jgi:hypothetical protein
MKAENLTIEQQIQQAIESAPSRAVLEAATDKLAAFEKDLRETVERIAAMEKALAVDVTESARDLVKRGELPKFPNSDELRSARKRVAIVTDGIALQRQAVSSSRTFLSTEVNREMRKHRQATVTKLATALRLLQQAAAEDQQTVSAMCRAGLTRVDDLTVPFVGNPGWDAGWFAARRAEGYEV